MVVVSSIVPNVGNVVNQNQGFVMKVNVENNSLIELVDGVVEVTAISTTGVTVGVGLNVKIPIPAMASGANKDVLVVFETIPGIAVGPCTIDFKVSGYLGGPEWLTVASGAPFIFPVGVQGVFPLDPTGGNFTQIVEIHPE